ncbi:MAG: glycosyltransferase family 2 protein [Acidobacteria bacterium]|nr:glycosyltransferase family 2 protein [Acidobacteriota bacterium]
MQPSTGKQVHDGVENSQSGGSQPAPPLLSVVIPALNEEAGIAEIVRRVKATEDPLKEVGLRGVEVIVVDDGSRDRTADIVSRMPGVRLIRHDGNRGYGAAIKTGLRQARGELLAFLDADGTYPPERLSDLCVAILRHGADVAVGSRRSGADSRMPPVRRLGNLIWSSLVTVIGHRRCADPASGMRVLRRSALSRLYPLPDGLNFTPVMSTRSMHEGLAVVELPIPYSERRGRSKLSVVRDGTRFLKTILWTSLEYNPVKVLGLVGLLLFAMSLAAGMWLVLARMRGITTLGYWGVLAVFLALVLGVAGVSIYSLGVTFNFLVALFHHRPVRQGLLGGRLFERSLESYFGWAGLLAIAMGAALTATAMVLGSAGWEMSRLWLWLLGSALFLLVGLQFLISWILARVLEALAERDTLIQREMRDDTNRREGEPTSSSVKTVEQ